jgi:uncharacterized membrane protein YhaH (DUF805 family)
MKAQLAYIYRPDGTVDRLTYLTAGLALFSIKYVLDLLIAILFFHRSWTLFNYLVYPAQVARITEMPPDDRWFCLTLLLVAMPFIWAGTMLTLRRLRDIELPPVLVGFFFLPFINALFFFMLCVLPGRPRAARADRSPDDSLSTSARMDQTPAATEASTDELPEPTLQDAFRVARPTSPSWSRTENEDSSPGLGTEGRMRRIRDIHRRVVPDKSIFSGGLAVGVSAVFGVALTFLSVQGLRNYGWGLFVGVPFCLGLFSVLIYGIPRRQSPGACMLVAFLSTVCYGGLLLVTAFEGAVCLIMAAPLGVPIALFGGAMGYVIQSRFWLDDHVPGIFLAVFLTLPGLMAAEYASDPQPPLLEVTTSVEIDASPTVVWSSLVSFPPLAEPDE